MNILNEKANLMLLNNIGEHSLQSEWNVLLRNDPSQNKLLSNNLNFQNDNVVSINLEKEDDNNYDNYNNNNNNNNDNNNNNNDNDNNSNNHHNNNNNNNSDSPQSAAKTG